MIQRWIKLQNVVSKDEIPKHGSFDLFLLLQEYFFCPFRPSFQVLLIKRFKIKNKDK
jgi:hypothetical protein